MSFALTMLVAMTLLLGGVVSAGDVANAVAAPSTKKQDKNKASDSWLKVLTSRNEDGDENAGTYGHTASNVTMEDGALLNVPDNSTEASTRMLSVVSAPSVGKTERIIETDLAPTVRQKGTCKIPWRRPVACYTHAFVARTWRRDTLAITGIIAYGKFTVGVGLVNGGPVNVKVALAVSRTPTRFYNPEDNDGTIALYIWDIYKHMGVNYGTCCGRRVQFRVAVYSCYSNRPRYGCGTEIFSYWIRLPCLNWCPGTAYHMQLGRRCSWCRR